MPHPKQLLADRAYDANSLRNELAQLRIKAITPPNPTRRHSHRYDKAAYKAALTAAMGNLAESLKPPSTVIVQPASVPYAGWAAFEPHRRQWPRHGLCL